MDFVQTLKTEGEKVSALLEKFCAAIPDTEVKKAVLYSLRSDGKRLRPVLALQTAKMLGASENDENIERIAAAIEMIHTYSLIHDDLPCMDDDDLRRGMPACHKEFGEGMAVLAGDALLNLAYETLLGGKYSESYFNAIKYIADCSGSGPMGMVAGQSDDISDTPKDTLNALIKLAEKKTAALFVASMMAVGIYLDRSGGAVLWNLCGIGANLGIAFQIADDILDVNSNEKANFATLLGVDQAKATLSEYTSKAVNSAASFGKDSEFFLGLIYFNKERAA